MSNPSKLFGKDKDELTFLIEGREIPVIAGRLLLTMDTGAFEFTATFSWEPFLDPEIDRVTRPYSYSECAVYIAGVKMMDGILYNVEQRTSVTGTEKEIEIFSKTADVIDSSVRYPFEENNLTLLERCLSQMTSSGREFGIDVILDSGVDIGGKFSRIDAENIDNCYNKLAELASQRGLLLSCTVDGNLLITQAKTTSAPVGTVEEGGAFASEYSAAFNGRGRYQKYESITDTNRSGKSQIRQTAIDSVVTRPRFLTFKSNDSLPGEALNAAEWRKNKSAADAMTLNFPVNSWYAPNGTVWQPNTTVTIISPTIGLKNGFTFLINRVEFEYRVDGTTAILQLKPPSAYTTGILEEPWLE